MSSPRKDARWQLATAMAEACGLDGYGEVTSYPTWEKMLLAADELIRTELSDAKVEDLARQWNARGVEEERPKDYAGEALLKVTLRSHVDHGNPMMGDPGEAWVEVFSTEVLSLEIVPRDRDLAYYTAQDALLGESDDHPTRVLEQAIFEKYAPPLAEVDSNGLVDIIEDVVPGKEPVVIETSADFLQRLARQEKDGEVG